MKQISKHFPGVQALKDVDLEVKAGEVHALLGENGAGKSTLIKILGGIYQLDGGEIRIEGKPSHINNVHDAQKRGISVIHQELVLVPQMTVAENIYLGREPLAGGLVDFGIMNSSAAALMESFDLDMDPETKLAHLTIAQQQMVEIIKALSFNSKIVVMDEPTSSLSEKEVRFLFETIGKLKKQGVGIIYISHRMSELFEISDRITVLRDGGYVGTRETALTSAEELITMMVGRTLTNYYTRTRNEPGEPVLEVNGLRDGALIHDVSFFLRKGEILGFAGLVGAGRSEVMKSIFGFSNGVEGTILVEGKPVRIQNPNDALACGIAYVPESRKEEALFLTQSVKFNTSIKVLDKFIQMFIVRKQVENDITDHYIRRMSIKTPNSAQIVENLSGGNQQKVVIGRWLATNPRILILDEPTRGVDVGAKAEIYRIMNDLAAQGVGIIMISSELPEVINMSDRVVVMSGGTVAGCLGRDELDQEKIMHLAALHNEKDTVKESGNE